MTEERIATRWWNGTRVCIPTRGNRDELSQRGLAGRAAPRLETFCPGALLTVGPVGPNAPPAVIIPLYRAHYHLESGGQLILQPRPRAPVSGQWGGLRPRVGEEGGEFQPILRPPTPRASQSGELFPGLTDIRARSNKCFLVMKERLREFVFRHGFVRLVLIFPMRQKLQ